MNLRATFATASLVFASTLTAASYSTDVLANSVADQPVPVNIAVKRNPIPATKKSVGIGTKDYTESCFGCHGPMESGSSSMDISYMTDGELFWKIKRGHGDLNMKMSSRQVWHLINYLRSE